MDAKRLKVLRSIDYVINKSCDLCRHAQFDFDTDAHDGVCALFSMPDQPLRVYRGGVCGEFSIAMARARNRLNFANSGFVQFLDRRLFSRNNRHKAKTNH